MTQGKKSAEKQSFIGDARREQIVLAAITTLDEIGFFNASLAQIAKRAGISTALISYHFRDKQNLMDHTLTMLVESNATYVIEQMHAAPTTTDKLHTFITASLAYQGRYPQRNVALVEIVFHARTADDVPYYKLSDDEEDPQLRLLRELLEVGQATGAFRSFDATVMATVIQAAINEYSLNPKLTNRYSADAYAAKLIGMFDHLTLADAP